MFLFWKKKLCEQSKNSPKIYKKCNIEQYVECSQSVSHSVGQSSVDRRARPAGQSVSRTVGPPVFEIYD